MMLALKVSLQNFAFDASDEHLQHFTADTKEIGKSNVSLDLAQPHRFGHIWLHECSSNTEMYMNRP